MKISDDLPPQDSAPVGIKTADREKIVPLKARNSADEQGGEGKVTISQKARDIRMIRAMIEKAPDVRPDRIAHLKKKIAAGDYKVAGKEIADKMLRECLLEDLLKNEH